MEEDIRSMRKLKNKSTSKSLWYTFATQLHCPGEGGNLIFLFGIGLVDDCLEINFLVHQDQPHLLLQLYGYVK